MRYTLSGFLSGIIASFFRTLAYLIGRSIAISLSPWAVLILFIGLAGTWIYHWYQTEDHVRDYVTGSMDLQVEQAQAPCTSVLIDFYDELSEAQIQDVDDMFFAELYHDGGYDRPLIRVLPSQDCAEDIRALQGHPYVQAVSENGTYSALGLGWFSSAPNDPLYEHQWNMKMVDAEYSWAHSKSGKGIVVAVLDTGVQITEDLDKSQVLEGRTFAGGTWGKDPGAHGTHVTGSIAQWTNNGKGVTGLAKNATILPVKVLSDQGSGSWEGISEGIHWAVDQGADVINMSLGGTSSGEVMAEAVKYAIDHDVLVVAAAGNSANNRPHYPSSYPGVISVSSVGPTGELSYFSNYGPRIDIAAPGGDKNFGEEGGILQGTCPQGKCGYYSYQGTSMASPHVAAAVAILLGEGVKPKDVLEILHTQDERDDSFGYGIINMKTALDKIRHPGGCGGF